RKPWGIYGRVVFWKHGPRDVKSLPQAVLQNVSLNLIPVSISLLKWGNFYRKFRKSGTLCLKSLANRLNRPLFRALSLKTAAGECHASQYR
ncbi:MAG: hypothetical protein ACKO0V_17850, partial [bacterium]